MIDDRAVEAAFDGYVKHLGYDNTHAELVDILREWLPDALRAALTAAAPFLTQIPDGWKLVPVEPTPSMIGAAWSRISADKKALGISRLGIGPGVGEWWAAMLLAAPLPPPTEKNDG